MSEEVARQMPTSMVVVGQTIAVAVMVVVGISVVRLALQILVLSNFRVPVGYTIPRWVIIRPPVLDLVATLKMVGVTI